MKKIIISLVVVGAVVGGWMVVNKNDSPSYQAPVSSETPNKTSEDLETIKPTSPIEVPIPKVEIPTPKKETTVSKTVPPAPTTSTAPKTSFTLSEVAKHSTQTDCWTTINGSIYDVTSWINQHPGGAGAIISLCGIDGSSAFNGQHGGQARPATELASFKIGTLTK
jgi:cytochrome b involved in lipid metabolism